MSDLQIATYELNSWNFDLLQLKPSINCAVVPDEKLFLSMDYKLFVQHFHADDIDRVFYLGQHTLLLVSMKKKSVWLYRHDIVEISTIYAGSAHSTWVDATVLDCVVTYPRGASVPCHYLYILEQDKISQIQIDYRLHVSVLDSIPVNPGAGCCIAAGKKASGEKDLTTLVLLQCQSAKATVIDLEDNSIHQTNEVLLRLPAEYPKWNAPSAITTAYDANGRTIIVCDQQNHSILEGSLVTGKTKVICGTGAAGNGKEGDNPADAQVCAPCRPVIYRTEEYVGNGYLTPTSQRLLNADPNHVLPRMLLFCDKGNGRVARVLQCPVNSLMALHLNGLNRIYTLLASSKYAQRGRLSGSLFTYSVESPKDMHVSWQGDLLVSTSDKLMIFKSSFGYLEDTFTNTELKLNDYIS